MQNLPGDIAAGRPEKFAIETLDFGILMRGPQMFALIERVEELHSGFDAFGIR